MSVIGRLSVPLAASAFPERETRPTHAADDWARGVWYRLCRLLRGSVSLPLSNIEGEINRMNASLKQLDDRALVDGIRLHSVDAVRSGGSVQLIRALVFLSEACERAVGLRPYPVQLLGALTMAQGRLAEMQTGEGKTLTAGLAASLLAMAGVPVHVITVNDYLAQRDADTLAPLLGLLGLRGGVVVHECTPEQRRVAYACDITWCTGKELVFDYLRDRVAARGRATAAQLEARALFGRQSVAPVLRGLHFAIVDEADSILIDEARTPLILAEKAGPIEHEAAMPRALALAGTLQRDHDYLLDERRKEIVLTQSGRTRLHDLCQEESAPWHAADVREHLTVQALRAIHLFIRDRHYLVDDEGVVQIIDEYTGRVLPGRTWEGGLHQMIECKEGVEPSEQTRTLARITYQRFFARYLRLAGMTGTAREVAPELAVVYGLVSLSIPPNRPSRRRSDAPVCAQGQDDKWLIVIDWVRACHQRGQPVLVGTRSVAASERLSQCLTRAGIAHRVLSARQDAQEAAVVAEAGALGSVTVATNMAGRGTDIHVDPQVEALGGLCVILTEYHESRRIDRQLLGRCARQGQPGRTLEIVAIDDELFVQHASPLLRRVVERWGRFHPILALMRKLAQWRAERMHARTRRDTLRQDWQLEHSLGFSGDPI